jgi:hypothetical protein
LKTAAILYIVAGAAWWVVTQAVYVNGGYPYWQGIGTASDPNQVFGGILNSLETITLWPYAAVQTTKLNQAKGD